MYENNLTHSQITKEMVKVVDAPRIFLTEDETALDVLMKFYYALGWNGKDILDPYKIHTTNEIYNMLYELMLEKYPDSLSVGLAMINQAPSVDESIPLNKVYLLDGWVRPSEGVDAKC